MTIIERCGSLAISRRTTRARGKLCDIHGFLPTNTATSACSNSPRVWPPYSCASTHASPVFSWASAFERCERRARAQRAAVGAAEVVALAAAAVIEDPFAAVLVAHAVEAGGDLAIAVSQSICLEAAVRAPAQRRGQPVGPFW